MMLLFALLGGCAVASSVTMLYAARQRAQRTRASAEGSAPGEPPPPSAKAASPYAALPLALGDVVAAGGEERWLAGGVICREAGRVVGALFVAPEGAELVGVGVLAPPTRSIDWLTPIVLDSPAEPPSTIEIGEVIYTRRQRRPVQLERVGAQAPAVGPEGMLALYAARARDVAWVLTSAGQTFAFRGQRVDEGGYDRMGSGGGEV